MGKQIAGSLCQPNCLDESRLAKDEVELAISGPDRKSIQAYAETLSLV